MRRILTLALAAALTLSLAACARETVIAELDVIPADAVALLDAPPESAPETSHPGTLTKSNDRAEIDYSNAADGYVTVLQRPGAERRGKAQVFLGDVFQTYDLTPGEWAALPLSRGDGEYRVVIYENTSGDKYATVLSATVDVVLTDEFAPFLRPNQYVNYEDATATVAKAAELAGGESDVLAKVDKIYDYVTSSLTYDHELAATVKSGYLPDLDAVLARGEGICFDYAALMTGMLRSQGVPTKLVVGFVGTQCHAWVSVYSDETGWVDGVIHFDGDAWRRMDPTFGSSGKNSKSTLSYIDDDAHYLARRYY